MHVLLFFLINGLVTGINTIESCNGRQVNNLMGTQ